MVYDNLYSPFLIHSTNTIHTVMSLHLEGKKCGLLIKLVNLSKCFVIVEQKSFKVLKHAISQPVTFLIAADANKFIANGGHGLGP